MKPVIQLSQLKVPRAGKGRVYTVKSGVAKPLPGKLLSKLFGNPVRSILVPPNKLRLTAGLFALYLMVFLSFNGSGHIIYADPIIHKAQPAVVPMLTMPVLAAQEPRQSILIPVASNLPNTYTWGNCTAYVASKLPVPSDWGNAISWGTSALVAGYEVSDIPKVGSIAWSVTDSYLGHVALVEAVNGDQVTVSEMNFNGLGVVDTRIANPGEFRYIYL